MGFIPTCYCAGSRAPRFDPTAYIQDRTRRQKEAELKKLVHVILLFESPSVFLYQVVSTVVTVSSVSDRGRCGGTC